MSDILNLALPYFGLIFIGFACGKTNNLPEAGLAWMNLLYVSLPALRKATMPGLAGAYGNIGYKAQSIEITEVS